jgi:hypothetical protein
MDRIFITYVEAIYVSYYLFSVLGRFIPMMDIESGYEGNQILVIYVSQMVLYAVGAYYGKIRMTGFVIFLSYILMLIELLIPFTLIWLISVGMQLFATLFFMLLCYNREYEIKGPYGVGYREFRLETGNKPWISVYYPVDLRFYGMFCISIYKSNTHLFSLY